MLMNVLGLKIRGHDPGAALISGGKIIAISEERLSRIKHSFEIFPSRSIEYCLGATNLRPENIDLIVMDQVSARWRVPIKQIFEEKTEGRFSKVRIEVVNHQDAHAASAFFASPFTEAAILVYDGAGEIYRTHLGVAAIETETLYRGVGNRIVQIQKTLHLRDGKSCPYTQGIGKLYSEITYYLAMGKYNEGKTMGLAPYGNDSILKMFPPEMWFTEREGHILVNSRVRWPSLPLQDRITRRKSLKDFFTVLKYFVKMRVKRFARPLLYRAMSRFYSREMFMEPKIFPEIRFPRPPRSRADTLPDDYYASVAYAIQKVLEMVACRLGKKLRDITGSENLSVAGGVGLNIDANSKFLTEPGFKRIFVQPGASDAGIPLGCALWGYHVILGLPRFWEMKSASLGRSYTEEEIKRAINERVSDLEVKKSKAVAKEVARFLADGKIVGWFYGGSEYGPRALGNRSILCDARGPDMKDIVNKRVKHRESWRPFAASVLKEEALLWFDLKDDSPFMLLVADVKKEKRSIIPAVVHVDGTCRIQTVTKKENGRYYDLISEFKKITGTPLILDTSFNLAGEPIVETPADAIKSFLSTDMDYLVLEDYVITKKS